MPLRAAGTALPPTRCCRRCYGSYVFVQPPPLILGLAGARTADGGSSREMGEQQQQHQPNGATQACTATTLLRPVLSAPASAPPAPGTPVRATQEHQQPHQIKKSHHRQQNESYGRYQKYHEHWWY